MDITFRKKTKLKIIQGNKHVGIKLLWIPYIKLDTFVYWIGGCEKVSKLSCYKIKMLFSVIYYITITIFSNLIGTFPMISNTVGIYFL